MKSALTETSLRKKRPAETIKINGVNKKRKTRRALKPSKRNASKTKESKKELKTLNQPMVDLPSPVGAEKKTSEKESESLNQPLIDFPSTVEVGKKITGKVGRVLPEWIARPTCFSADLRSNLKPTDEVCPLLEKQMHNLLKKNDISYFFPVQESVIPLVLETHCGAELRWRPRDVCVAAPTGSGKTLAYVLPIVQLLSKMRPIALRALVILPVAELALQVYEVFKVYATPYDLKVGKDTGLNSFQEERKHLINKHYGSFSSNVDILVVTPQRLLDHIVHTRELRFDSLSFLVLDEADILMSGEFASIINRIQNHIFDSQARSFEEATASFTASAAANNSRLLEISKVPIDKPEMKFPTFSQLIRKSSHRFSYFDSQRHSGEASHLDANEREQESLSDMLSKVSFAPQLPTYGRRYAHRLFFSATLSHDPHLLQNLSLYHPKLFTTASGKGTIAPHSTGKTVGQAVKPLGLREEFVVVSENLKPILLHHLLLQLKQTTGILRVLVFANSIEVVHKLAVLLRSLSRGKYVLREFTSGSHSSVRKMLVKRFAKGRIQVLVSTDAMARGIDIPDLQGVISYDVPSSNTYIHRVGRTARAGKTGSAISIVTKATLKYLKHAVGDNFDQLQEMSIKEEDLEQYEDAFKTALEILSSRLKKQPKTKTGKLYKTPKRPILNLKEKRLNR